MNAKHLPTMLKKFLFLFPIINCYTTNLMAYNISGSFDVYTAISWAEKQHNSICSKIYTLVLEGKVKPIEIDRTNACKSLSKEKTEFVSTDPDDPTIGFDTTFDVPIRNKYPLISIQNDHITIKADSINNTIMIEKTLLKHLDKEQLSYLNLYNKNGHILYQSIGAISIQLMVNYSRKLYTSSMNFDNKLYQNDSLNTIYDQEERASIGRVEIIVFVLTDKDDSTIGFDSTYWQPYTFDTKDTSDYFCIFYCIGPNEKGLTPIAYSNSYVFNSYCYPCDGKKYLDLFGFVKTINLKSNFTTEEIKLMGYWSYYSMAYNIKNHQSIHKIPYPIRSR